MRIHRSKVFTALSACLVVLASTAYAHAASFTIGGTVSGLTTGNSVTLLDNGGDSLKVTANGKFTFTTALASGATYSVTVGTQPTGETCTVTAGSGTVGTANVTAVKVACKATTYTIGGTASGLLTGRSVTLLDNGGGALKVTKNGAFTFKTGLVSGAAYDVTISVQPSGETCTVTAGSGTVGTSDVTSVAVACTPKSYTIGGTVSGLSTGASVTLLDNGGDSLKVTANGAFTFATPVASGAAYKVTVSVQPTGETCTVTKGAGKVVAVDVTTVVVACKVLTFTVGGTVSGLSSGSSVTLLDNGTNSLTVTANGTFTFTTALDYGATYSVTVGTQPSGETCTVTAGSGTVTKKVSTVKVTCKASSTFTIGGTVSGLNTSASVKLLDNGGNALTVSTNGSFTFTTALASGATYSVTVGTQPTGETCTVTKGSGTVGSANVTNEAVACASATFSIGGTVSGLNTSTSVTLLDNGGNALTVSANGSFTFTTKLASGAAYSVTVGTQPTGETCTVTNGSGTVGSANVTNVAVACAANPTFSIGGTVSGLSASTSVKLLDNGGNALTVSANGSFTFTTKLASGATYSVTVGTQPTGETCTVTNGSGTVGSANVTNVAVACAASATFSIGGTVSGLSASTSVTLLDNGGNALTVSANGSFTFTTKLASGATYSVTVGTQPTGETCTVTNGSGTVGSSNVTNVAVACSSGSGGGSAYWIPYSASPVSGATPPGSTGLFVIPSDKVSSSPAPTFITTDVTQLLGIGTQITESGGVLTYSPQVMMDADTNSAGVTKIYGLTLAGTSTVPSPTQISSLAVPSGQEVCQITTSETNVTQPTTLFAVLEVGTATQCISAGGTFEVVHYTDSSTTAPVVVSLNTTTMNGIYQNGALTGLLVFDSATNSLDIYADDTFTSPTKEITGLQNASYVSGVLDEATLSTSGVFVSATTTGGVTDLYRIDGATQTATLVQNLMTGTVSTVAQDDTNLYYMVLTGGASSTVATFNQVALTGGTPKLLYTSPAYVPEGSAGLVAYQLIGSNDSVLAFEFYSEPTTSGSLDPTKATATLYTVPVGETTTTPTTLANYPAGDLLTNVFLSAPSGSGLSSSVLFVTVRNASGSISAPTIAYSAVSIPLNGGTAPAPIANSAYEQLAVISGRLSYSVWQVIGITDTNGGWGGGTAYTVNVSTLVDTPFTTTGGADYVFGKGFSAGLEAISSNNIAIGILNNSSALASGATPQEDGVAADLTKSFFYPIVLTNTNVLPY